MQSGESQFVLAHTEEFDKLLVGLDADGKKKLADKIEKTWKRRVHVGEGARSPRAPRPAPRATCKAFHLVYDRGKGGSLTKVDVS